MLGMLSILLNRHVNADFGNVMSRQNSERVCQLNIVSIITWLVKDSRIGPYTHSINMTRIHPSKRKRGGAWKWCPTRKSYQNMKTRCLNPNRQNSKWYIQKGIKICDRWLGSDGFKNFLNDMGERPEDMTLERINNDDGYNPDNCCWATWKTQFNNRSHTHLLTFNGKTQSITMWAKETGLNRDTIGQRIRIFGWSTEKALTTPLQWSA